MKYFQDDNSFYKISIDQQKKLRLSVVCVKIKNNIITKKRVCQDMFCSCEHFTQEKRVNCNRNYGICLANTNKKNSFSFQWSIYCLNALQQSNKSPKSKGFFWF